MSRHALFVAVWATGCSEQEFNFRNLPSPPSDLRIRGRVCDPVTRTWVADALVYTHLYDDHDVVYDSRSTYTDPDGNYELTDLVADKEYEIYVQVGHAIIDQFGLGVGTEDVSIPPEPCAGNVDRKVAVVTGGYDDLAPTLAALGITGIRMIDGQAGTELVDFLTDPTAMGSYDAIFFDGGHREDGVVYGEGPVLTVQDALRSYVDDGGMVFASDWAYDVVEQTWPEMLDFAGDDTVPDAAQIGEIGLVDAQIVDPGLASVVQQDEVQITYDLPVWPVIDAASPEVEVWLEGDAPWRIGLEDGNQPRSPLLVGFDQGDGRVLLSTYRSRANDDPVMLSVLRTVLDEPASR